MVGQPEDLQLSLGLTDAHLLGFPHPFSVGADCSLLCVPGSPFGCHPVWVGCEGDLGGMETQGGILPGIAELLPMVHGSLA